jgi:predicted RND superfamily exporter protein
LVFLLLVILAVIGAFRLKLDVEVLNLLPGNNQVSRGLLLYQKRFLNSGELIITVQAESAEESSKAVDAIVHTLSPATNLLKTVFWQPPWNDSIMASAQFLAYLWLNGPTQKVEQLARSLQPANLNAVLAETQERMATSLNPADLMLAPRDPYNFSGIASMDNQTLQTPERFFASEDGHFRMIYAYAAVPLENYEDCHRWLRQIRPLISQALNATGTNAQVQLTGRPVFVDEIASGMKSDMSTNAPGTLFMIGLLFYLVHREVKALLLLLLVLLIVMVWTALIGAAFLGQLNVISIGFASILLGLAEDFGIVLHQEAKSHPHLPIEEVRRLAGPGIFWSAVTTAAAFGLLNLSSLPGLRQLGTLVALGIALGAWVMVHLFLPLLFRFQKKQPTASEEHRGRPGSGNVLWPRVITACCVLAALAVLALKRPTLNSSPDVLRPRQSEASRALALVQKNLGVELEPYWVISQGRSAGELRHTLEQLQPVLEQDVHEGRISSFNLPLEIWPDPAGQKSNTPLLKQIALQKDLLIQAALAHGFTTNGLQLTETVLDEWSHARADDVQWPHGRIAEWLLPRFASVTATNVMALGLVYPTATFDPEQIAPSLPNVLVSGWHLLGQQVFGHVKREVPVISVAVIAIVFFALYLTFRTWSDVLLSFGILGFSGVVLLAIMALFHWDWNLINLTSLPLLLGMGIDYSIHIQLALKRLDYDRPQVFHTVGRALLLAGSTSIIGFALLGTSSNLGMAGLGQVCALGLTIVLLSSVFLLPGWTSRLEVAEESEG